DTKPLGQTIVHIGKLREGSALSSGVDVTAEVDQGLREATRRHHTGTHLLHAALREVVGDHVVQQGSYVGPDRLRFDFSNPGGLNDEALDEIERVVNQAICRDDSVLTQEEQLEEAKARGVTALFGEKYDDVVRVVDVGGWSTELCGGTHVTAAGQVGPFVLLSERAIQAGVRRVEAVCGPAAVAEMQAQRSTLREAAGKLKVSPVELPERIAQLQSQVKEAKSAAKKQAKGDLDGALESVRSGLSETGGVYWGAIKLDGLDMQSMRELSGRVKSLHEDLAVALMSSAGGGVPFMVLSQGAAQDKGILAGELSKELGARVGGGGGGRPDSGQGQGSKPEALDDALVWVSERLQGALGG
ncbi:MAG: DHHA1 domain-containing protein, partial [Planctomycetes bacterium]|nr:DHHA1 domain-containing protein [Planctomycetota bacterium]